MGFHFVLRSMNLNGHNAYAVTGAQHLESFLYESTSTELIKFVGFNADQP